MKNIYYFSKKSLRSDYHTTKVPGKNPVLKAYRGFEVPKEPEFDRFREWVSAVMEEPSVIATLQPKDKLIEKYRRYADNSAKSEVAEAIRKGKVLP